MAEAIDLKKLEVALTYIERMTEGHNPVTNQRVQEEDVLNNPNVIRCMYFIRDVLLQVKENKGIIGGRAASAKKEPFPFEVLEKFQYEKDKSISHLLKQVSGLAENENVKTIGYKVVTDYLKATGYLSEEVNPENNHKKTLITEKGMQMGLYPEHRISAYGEAYDVIMYNQAAQEFVVKNLERMVNREMPAEQ